MIKHGSVTRSQEEAMLNIIGGEAGLQRLLDGKMILVDPANVHKKGVKLEERPLFTFSGTFKAPGAKEFVVDKKFVVDTSENARVRISWMGDNFKTNFLPLVEHEIAPSNIILSKLARDQHDLPMSEDEPGTIFGLGGLSKAQSSACEFYETLAYKQAAGDLSWTVGYAWDVNGVLWPLDGGWDGGGWLVGAGSVGRPFRWDAGREFVSR